MQRSSIAARLSTKEDVGEEQKAATGYSFIANNLNVVFLSFFLFLFDLSDNVLLNGEKKER